MMEALKHGAVFEGILAAFVVCTTGFLLSFVVGRRIDTQLVRRGLTPGVAGFFTGIIVRFAVCVGGIIAVYVLFGRTTVVSCALAMMPLCLIEVIVSTAVGLRRVKRQSTLPAAPLESRSNQEGNHEWN